MAADTVGDATRPRAAGCPASPAAALAALLASLLAIATPTFAATITAEVDSDVAITRVVALRRDATKIGTYTRPVEGRLDDGLLTFDDLPPGQYDLRFETEAGPVEGWNANVPRSDYVEEQPLAEESRRVLIDKLSGTFATGFFDRAWLLTMDGNIQNAAMLVFGLRTRPFAEGDGTTRGVWIWRVDRYQYEDPYEQTWAPWQERPHYALHRQRIPAATFDRLSLVFAQHLGGIVIEREDQRVELGRLHVPAPQGGIYAVTPDGTRIDMVQLKPRPARRNAPTDATDDNS